MHAVGFAEVWARSRPRRTALGELGPGLRARDAPVNAGAVRVPLSSRPRSPTASAGCASVAVIAGHGLPSRTSLGWSWRQPALAGRAVSVPAGQRGLEVALDLVEADQAAAD